MAHFKIPPAPKIFKQKISQFKGLDYANSPAQMASGRSPNAENIISDLAGKPIKRSGTHVVADFSKSGYTGSINGVFLFQTERHKALFVHVGNRLLLLPLKIREPMSLELAAEKAILLSAQVADEKSWALQLDKWFVFLDGKDIKTFEDFNEFVDFSSPDNVDKIKANFKSIEAVGKVPVTTISTNPDGTGGVARQRANILTTRRENDFYVNDSNKDKTDFYLDTPVVLPDPVVVEILGGDGKWKKYHETGKASVDGVTYDTGVTITRHFKSEQTYISLSTPPGVSPVRGRDNVKITFSAPRRITEDIKKAMSNAGDSYPVIRDDYKPPILKATTGALYGVNGKSNQLFLSGNPDVPNGHWWSLENDPTYFPDENTALIGQSSARIIGYSKFGDSLVIHKTDNGQDPTIFICNGFKGERSGELNKYPVVGSIIGEGAVSAKSFAFFGSEPIFLTHRGVFAITSVNLSGDRQAQSRSYYIDPRLTKESGLSKASAIVYNGYYYLAVNGKVYVADSRQKQYERNSPFFSEFQYEWYLWTGLDVVSWFEYEDKLYFGSTDGRIIGFNDLDGAYTKTTYTDCGKPYKAFWDTPYYTFGELARYKTLKGFWLMVAPERHSSVAVYYRYRGSLKLARKRILDRFSGFDDVDFERFTFSTDDAPYVMATNAKAKKFMVIQFRIENDEPDEGFGFYEAEAQYTIGGRYKE